MTLIIQHKHVIKLFRQERDLVPVLTTYLKWLCHAGDGLTIVFSRYSSPFQYYEQATYLMAFASILYSDMSIIEE